MMEWLDPRTLVVATLFIALVVSIATGIFWLESDRPSGIGYAVVSYSLATAGLTLLAGRGVLPDALSLVAAQVILLLGNLTMLSCLRLLAGLPPLPPALLTIAASVTVGWHHWYSVVEPDLPMRIGFNAATTTTIALLGAWTCLRCGPPHEVARRVVGWVLCGHALFVVTLGTAAATHATLTESLFALQNLVVARTLEAMAVTVLTAALLLQLMALRLRRRIERDAVTDPLTGLLNRRGFEAAAMREVMRRGELDGVLMVAVMDLDHFKRVNDRFGHQAGDRVLTGVAGVIGTTLRPAELIGRIGGEEFAIVLRMTSARDAGNLMERLRAAVEGHTVVLPSGEETSVTISAGYTTVAVDAGYPADGINPEQLFERLFGEADAALYRAKDAGRNRVRQGESTAMMSDQRPDPDRVSAPLPGHLSDQMSG